MSVSIIANAETKSSTEWSWYLTGSIGTGESVRYIPINSDRFTIGRKPNCDLAIPSAKVSGEHAQPLFAGDALVLRDSKSTNGTFVNGRRLEAETVLGEGDLIHFAEIEFRVGRRDKSSNYGATVMCTSVGGAAMLIELDELINRPSVVPYFQPIVKLPDESICGFEVLARSTIEGLKTPREMFMTATQFNLEKELSTICREEGVRIGSSLPGSPALFVNTHPVEKNGSDLLDSLCSLRKSYPDQLISLEVHEGAVTNLNEMRELQATLDDLNIDLVYDDFGAGQARLLELIEVPPTCLKFDMSLIRDIHKASSQRQLFLATLVKMVRELGISALAEGVEGSEEGAMCTQLGFDFAQGYHYGKPAPAEAYRNSP